MKTRHLMCVFVACLAPLAVPTDALAGRSNLTQIAEASVIAVQDPTGVRTGFAFANADVIIASTSINTGVHLITAHGVVTVGDTAGRDQELAAVQAPPLHLLPLRKSNQRAVSRGTLAYVLGAPLGYEGQRIRVVQLPALKLHNPMTVMVTGHLPKSFQGAPVVTHSGRVIGAVAAVGVTRWTLASQVRLITLAAAKRGGGEGISVLFVLLGVLILITAVGALVTIRVRRTRNRIEGAPVVVQQSQVTDPSELSAQPLVRRRGPHADNDQDFEIILKSEADNEPS
jgi:hypothetical protein